MFLRYRADGETEDTLLEFRPDKTLKSRAVIAEKLYSKLLGQRGNWEQLKADAIGGGIAARTVALWLAMTVKHPLLRFEDIPDFETGQLGLEYSRQELRLLRKGIEDNDTMLESEKAAQLAQVDREIADAPVGSDEPEPEPEPAIEEPGKADDEPGTGEPSTS